MALDSIHEAVKAALLKDGWDITSDPYRLSVGGSTIIIDLGAEKVIAAEKESEKIVVEIKSITGKSVLYSFYPALGQYLIYRDALLEEGIKREVYLSTSQYAFSRLKRNPFLVRRMNQYEMKFIVVDDESETVVQWIK
jgi:hypothetical protein